MLRTRLWEQHEVESLSVRSFLVCHGSWAPSSGTYFAMMVGR